MVDLWIPASAVERERRLLCSTCGAEYPLTQRPQWERHIIHCDKVHEESERLAHEHINEATAYVGRDLEALEAREKARVDGKSPRGVKGF